MTITTRGLLALPPLTMGGRNGYQGASHKLADLTAKFMAARSANKPTAALVHAIGAELSVERRPTPDGDGQEMPNDR